MQSVTALRTLLVRVCLALALTGAALTNPAVGYFVQPGPVAGGSLNPEAIPKYADNLPILGTMPKSGTVDGRVEYYQIAVRQFGQQLLPPGFPATTIWGYGSLQDEVFTYPGRTIEAVVNQPVRVKWINDLKDDNGKYLRHLFPVDQTLHWANPPQQCLMGPARTDCKGYDQNPYDGPVPLVTHLHGAHVTPESDGYPEAWTLPAATDIEGYAPRGSNWGQILGAPDEAGAAYYQYPNDQRATTLWYHDHALGMTRANVQAGVLGFYLIRGGSWDLSSPLLPKDQYEVPLILQDKSFNADGSLFFPDNRAFFEGLEVSQLQIPFIPQQASGGPSDVPPIWNPEFFGNTILVNGKTWPKLEVEKRRYRFRMLNASDTRVVLLKIASDPEVRPATSALPFWQIGADGGFLPKAAQLPQLLIAPAERVDFVLDFTTLPVGSELYLINEGPDEPFGGGVPGVDFFAAHPGTTGQVMKFVVKAASSRDRSTAPNKLPFPSLPRLGKATNVRTLSLNEAESATVPVVDYRPQIPLVRYEPENPNAVPFAPVMALLGTSTVGASGVITPHPNEWADPLTENPALGATEVWEIYNFTEDAHPIHVHQVQFEVVNRQAMAIRPDGTGTLIAGTVTAPEPGETGTKDTVLVYPGSVTRVKARFDLPGLYIWHCHIISHEDNEMMRPFCVGNLGNCP